MSLPLSAEQLAPVAHLASPGATAARLSSAGERWTMAPHLRLISDEVTRACVRGGGRLVVAAPPRHGKTELLSHWLPVWYLALYPSRRVILASYADELATRNARLVRNTLLRNSQDPNALMGTALSDDSRAADRWHTREGGGLLAAGVGGGITGWGAHLLVVDDPFRGAEDAASEAYRERAWRWWQQDARTRLEPGGTVVVVATRWHEDDLTGRLLSEQKRGGERWTEITLRALAEGDDPLGRKPGEPLWPARFPLQALDSIRSGVGSYAWNALYQQRPTPAEGALVKREWWRWYDAVPADLDQIVQSWDLTFGASATSDYVAGHVWGRKGTSYYMLDRIHDRLDAPGQLRAIRALSERWPQATAKLVEQAANAQAVVALLQHEVPGLVLVPARGSKETRVAWAANASAPLIEAGNVYLPREAPWARDVVEEFAAFPAGAHDDDVDAATQAITYLAERARVALQQAHDEAKEYDEAPHTYVEAHRRALKAELEKLAYGEDEGLFGGSDDDGGVYL